MRYSVFSAGLPAAVVLVCQWAPTAHAGSGDAKANAARSSSALQQASHTVVEPFELSVCQPEEFAQPSKYYGPWEPTEIFGHDARCSPTPYAPRGYGFPKKLSPYRMDYAPYQMRDCGLGSVHGPATWWRRHRDPCCDPACGGCRRCDRTVDPQ